MKAQSPYGLGKMDELYSRLESLGCRAREWTLVVFAGDNGISLERTSHFAPLGSDQIVRAHLSGTRPTARLLKRLEKREWIIDIGLCDDVKHQDVVYKKVSRGTRNFVEEDALERFEVAAAISAGSSTWQLISNTGPDIVGLGEIGVGNTICAAALAAAATGLPAQSLVGPGTSDRDKMYKKADLIMQALEHRHPQANDVMDLLARFGGLEIAALTGFICAAARTGTPVMLDGFVTSTAALLASFMEEKVPSLLICPSVCLEPGHAIILDRLNLEPVLDLSMNHGEGLAAALGLFMAELAESFYH